MKALALLLLLAATAHAQMPGERAGATVKEDGSTVVRQAESLNVIEPDAALVTESPSGTARIDTSKYALLAGRAGGQTLNGGTGSSDHLTLNANDETFSFANTGRINLGERLTFSLGGSTSSAIDSTLLDITGTVTSTGSSTTGLLWAALRDRQVIEYDGILSIGGAPTFAASRTYRPRTAGTETPTSAHVGFLVASTYEPDLGTAITRTGQELVGFSAEPRALIRSGSHGGASVVLNNLDAYQAFTNALARTVGHVGAQTRVVTARGLHVQAPEEVSSGDIDLFVGVDIESSSEPDASYSLRSLGSGAEMRHAGKAIFGTALVSATAPVEGEVAAVGDRVECLRSTSTGDDPQEAVYQGRVATTGTSATAVWTRTLATDTAAGALVRIVARCTTGSSGCTVGQVFSGTYTCAWKNVSGTTSALAQASGAQTVIEDIGGSQTITCDTVSTTDMRVTVATGAASSNITWHATVRVMELQS